MSNRVPRRKSTLDQVNHDAAGIDVGATMHFVAVPGDRDAEPTRRFGSFTADLYRLADWLTACRIRTVVLESTGVYWIPLYQILEERRFDVRLVDARQVKNVSGRKSDVQDCEWLQQLHTFGLLRSAFRPDDQTVILRSFLRQRDQLMTDSGSHVQRMQKALTQMNLKLQHVISDITGDTGMRIIEAILSGERDANVLAQHRDPRCRNDKATIAKALQGHYRHELIFALRQALTQYRQCRTLITDCDQEIQALVTSWGSASGNADVPPPPAEKDRGKNALSFAARNDLQRITGVDLVAISGLNTASVLTILSETGTDMSHWPSSGHFASWLGLSPDNRISGGKILARGTKRCANRAATAFRLAAYGLHHAKCALGAYFRRMRTKLGTPKALTATAHKIARIFYAMVRHRTPFTDIGQATYERQYQERRIHAITRQAKELGFNLVAATA